VDRRHVLSVINAESTRSRGLTSGSARWLMSRATSHVAASGLLLSGEHMCRVKPGHVSVPDCKENGPRAFWLIEFWCLMNNTIRELIRFLVFVFVVHKMRRELDQGNEDATPQKKT
jgi:hypothetical protein